jgi:hypothetical protein
MPSSRGCCVCEDLFYADQARTARTDVEGREVRAWRYLRAIYKPQRLDRMRKYIVGQDFFWHRPGPQPLCILMQAARLAKEIDAGLGIECCASSRIRAYEHSTPRGLCDV